MKILTKICGLPLFLWAGIGFSAEQTCFNLIKEPVRICVSDLSPKVENSEVVIYDLEHRIFLASFEGRVVRNVIECSNCADKLNQLVNQSSSDSRLMSKFAYGHADLSFIRFEGFKNSDYDREFGSVFVGDASYPYTKFKGDVSSADIAQSH